MKYKIAAVIEIGSRNVSMYIGQLKSNSAEIIDILEHPTDLGHDVFCNAKISFESLWELSDILDKFKNVLKTYNITNYKVISCSVMREALNSDLVRDQISIINNMKTDILEDTNEKSLIYYDSFNIIKNSDIKLEGYSLFAYIGAGNIGISVYSGDKMIYFKNIPIGAFKINDMFMDIHGDTIDLPSIIQEYICDMLNSFNIPDATFSNIILTGQEISLISSLSDADKKNELYIIKPERIIGLRDTLYKMNVENIASRYNVSETEAAILYNSVSIYAAIAENCENIKSIYCPEVNISKAVLKQLISEKTVAEYKDYISKTAISYVKHLCQSWNLDSKHAETVEDYACRIFDKMRSFHGLGAENKLILRMCSMLYQCTPFAGFKSDSISVLNLISSMDISGINKSDTLITGFITAASRAINPIEDTARIADMLPDSKRIAAYKLSAIFSLACSLDYSKKQKLKDLKVSLSQNKLIIKANNASNSSLEKWAFDKKSGYFKSIFGISPHLKLNSSMFK